MRRIRKRVLFILLALTMLGTIAYFYINNIFIPVKFKAYVIKHSQEALNRDVEIDDVHFEFIKGFTFSKVRIFQRDRPSKLFFSADEISLNILLLAFLKNHNLVVPTIYLKNPYIFLEQHNYKSWNFSDLARKESPSKSSSVPAIFLRKMIIEKGSVLLRNTKETAQSDVLFENINLEATLSIDKNIYFTVSANTLTKRSLIALEGQYNFPEKKATSSVKLKNINFAQYTPFFQRLNSLAVNQTFLPYADFNTTLTRKSLHLTGDIAFDNLDYLFRSPSAEQSTGVSSDNTIAFSSDLYLKGFQVDWNPKILRFNGNVQTTKTAINIGTKTSFQGAFTSNVTKAIFQENDYIINGSAQIKATNFIVNKDSSFKGYIQTDDVSLTKIADILKIKGNYTIDQATIKTGSGQEIEGDLAFLNSELTNTRKSWVLESEFRADETKISLRPLQKFSGNILAQKARLEFSDKSIALKTPLSLTNAHVILNKDTEARGNFSSEKMNISLIDNSLRLETIFEIAEADIISGKNSFQGHPAGELNLTKNFNTEDLDYSGILKLSNANIRGIEFTDSVGNINGTIDFEPDFLKTKSLSFNTKNTDFTISGKLNDFKNPYLDIDVKTDHLNFETITPYVKKYLDQFKLQIAGASSLDLRFKGELQNPQDALISFSSVVKDASLITDRIPNPFKNINGKISYQKDLVQWDDLQASYLNKTYTSNGRIDNFSRPMLHASVKSDILDLQTQIKILRGVFEFVLLKGTYLHSGFDITGDVDLRTDPEPTISLNGDLNLNLKDVDALPETIRTKISPLNPAGQINAKGLFRGQLKKWRDWQLTFESQSPGILLKNHTFKNFTFNYAQRDRHISDFTLLSEIYGGTLEFKASADLIKDTIPMTGTASLTNLDLANYRKNNKVKNFHLSGNLSTALQFEGPLLNSKQIIGQGRAVIADGYLGQLIKDFKNAEFTDAEADFVIRNRRVLTNNAGIYSKTVDLRAQGWVDFDQNINFDIVPDFGEAGIIKADNIRIDASTLLSNAISMKITGTLSKPVKKVNKSPKKIIGNTTQIIREGIGSILQEVLP